MEGMVDKEGMTDKRFQAMMQMVIELIKTSPSVEEAARRVEEIMKRSFYKLFCEFNHISITLTNPWLFPGINARPWQGR